MEEWRDIKGYEGYYQVSNKGRVRSLDRIVNAPEKFGGSRIVKGQILALPLRVGYPSIGLFKNGKGEILYVHRIVAEAFIPNPENKPEVNHKDANRTNNNVENLEWVTHLENMQHSEDMCLRTINIQAAINSKKRKVLRSDGEVFESAAAAARALGHAGGQHIIQVCRGQRSNVAGYTFQYLD